MRKNKIMIKKGVHIKLLFFNMRQKMETKNNTQRRKRPARKVSQVEETSKIVDDALSALKPRKREQNKIAKRNTKTELTKVPDKSIAIQEDFMFKKDNLKIIPLGGIEEIGKNITVFEYGNDIVLDEIIDLFKRFQ